MTPAAETEETAPRNGGENKADDGENRRGEFGRGAADPAPAKAASGSASPGVRRSEPSPGHPVEAPRPAARVTSRDYANPYRPFPLGAVNAVGRALGTVGIKRPLDADSIVKASAKAAGRPRGYAGLDDDYREGLEVLVESIETEADLNPLGRMITRGRLVTSLKARFLVERLIEENPRAMEMPLATPLVITGLQRTGTTLLHRLIASDPRFRALSSWEVLDPVPPPESRRGKDPRLKTAIRAEKGAAWIAPDFFAVHPIDHKAPEEDVLLLDTTFRSTVAEAILRVPSYAAWLESADSEPAYAFMRKILLLLQAEDPRPYWILKTPHHLEFLDVLRAVFPEAKIVQTHRDPAKTVGSFLSMVAHGHGMFTDSPDPRDIGRRWMRKCHRMAEKGRTYRDSLPPEEEKKAFLDVQFVDLMADPIGVLSGIYDFAGIEFGEVEEAAAEAFLLGHGRHRFGRHVYDLSDFGYDEESVRRTFAGYRERYRVPDEN
jgi:hypothetical protein